MIFAFHCLYCFRLRSPICCTPCMYMFYSQLGMAVTGVMYFAYVNAMDVQI